MVAVKVLLRWGAVYAVLLASVPVIHALADLALALRAGKRVVGVHWTLEPVIHGSKYLSRLVTYGPAVVEELWAARGRPGGEYVPGMGPSYGRWSEHPDSFVWDEAALKAARAGDMGSFAYVLTRSAPGESKRG